MPWSALVHSDSFWPALASGLTWPGPVTLDDTIHEERRVNHTLLEVYGLILPSTRESSPVSGQQSHALAPKTHSFSA